MHNNVLKIYGRQGDPSLISIEYWRTASFFFAGYASKLSQKHTGSKSHKIEAVSVVEDENMLLPVCHRVYLCVCV